LSIELLNKRIRLDTRLLEDGSFSTREKAKRNIIAGTVYVNGKKETRPSRKVDNCCEIVITGDIEKYVSRGGLKLEKAIECFNIDLKGKNAIDVGASTGGFTDCMLKNGARHVIAVDSGSGQLAEELIGNSAVTNMEKTNIRYLSPVELDYIADFICVDVSFISLEKIFSVLVPLLKEEGDIVCLIKPQFEAGRENVGKNGVVKEPRIHANVIQNIVSLASDYGFRINGITYSPIKGPEGNIEYLIFITKTNHDDNDRYDRIYIQKLVTSAFKELKTL
jgi:23S rRNA (cytidine1920-2'-O)/16S rRNA (cytidine1409-2'-O)-methyltransferase